MAVEVVKCRMYMTTESTWYVSAVLPALATFASYVWARKYLIWQPHCNDKEAEHSHCTQLLFTKK